MKEGRERLSFFNKTTTRTLDTKRIIKKVLKEEHEKGSYRELFNEEVEQIVANNFDKIAKITIEDTRIEEFLRREAEDCVRLFLLRSDYLFKK